jgi:hypothetical protein
VPVRLMRASLRDVRLVDRHHSAPFPTLLCPGEVDAEDEENYQMRSMLLDQHTQDSSSTRDSGMHGIHGQSHPRGRGSGVGGIGSIKTEGDAFAAMSGRAGSIENDAGAPLLVLEMELPKVMQVESTSAAAGGLQRQRHVRVNKVWVQLRPIAIAGDDVVMASLAGLQELLIRNSSGGRSRSSWNRNRRRSSNSNSN